MFMILREVKEINAAISKTEKVMGLIICDALRDLVLVVQFKKREIHPWRSVTFSTKSKTPPQVFFTIFKLYKWYQIVQRTTNIATFL